MSFVGIIANPASGKDIRRLTSQATTVDNQQKVNIVRRLLVSLAAGGVRRVEIMPDLFGIGVRALDGLRKQPDILAITSLIDMPLEGTEADSLRAAQYLHQQGAGCIIVLGGDGTCRVVAKGCGEVPLLPIPTGTNNVVPYFIEGTVAGLAAAYVAQWLAAEGDVDRTQFCDRHKRLVIRVDGQEVDQTLVDVAVIATSVTGAKAVWQADLLRQLFVTRAQPVNIGISSVIGMVQPLDRFHPAGAMVTITANGRQVMAPLVPGTLVPVHIGQIVAMKPGVGVPVISERPVVLALDGERELFLNRSDRAEVILALDGPWLVDVEESLRRAVAEGKFEVEGSGW